MNKTNFDYTRAVGVGKLFIIPNLINEWTVLEKSFDWLAAILTLII